MKKAEHVTAVNKFKQYINAIHTQSTQNKRLHVIMNLNERQNA